MKSNQLVALLTTIIVMLSPSVLAANNQGWFEMEVILFSQTGDKTQLKETFLTPQALPLYKKELDLLGPYLQPNIANIKQQLPFCDTPKFPVLSVLNNKKAPQLPPLYQHKDLTTLESELAAESTTDSNRLISVPDDYQKKSQYSNTQITNSDLTTLGNVNEDQYDDFYDKSGITEKSTTDNNNVNLIEDNELSSATLAKKSLVQQTLLAQAEAHFSPIQFETYQQTPLTITCVWSEPYFQKHIIKDISSAANYNGLIVKEVATTIDNTENIYSDEPYLLSKNSLQLNDIIKKIKLSKNFKPLLHFGWRQYTDELSKAIPLKVFAGENLDYAYLEKVNQYQKELKQALQDEQTITNAILSDKNNASEQERDTAVNSDVKSPEQDFINDRIANILEEVEQVELDKAKLITELNSPELARIITQNDLITTAPTRALQPWYLDGYINISVSHYLHITADFNIVDTTLAEQATQKATNNAVETKAIRFEQDRRVISGEIHYFDHPYMGMVVQIRRFEKPEPEQEQDVAETIQ